jgi:hypothetical protein
MDDAITTAEDDGSDHPQCGYHLEVSSDGPEGVQEGDICEYCDADAYTKDGKTLYCAYHAEMEGVPI